MEFRFKTQVIFTVEADSEQEALQRLMDATGEYLYPHNAKPIQFNTMRAFEPLNSKEVVQLSYYPSCNLCSADYIRSTPAVYDARTKDGYWAYLCQQHFDELGVGLGIGKGQRIVISD